MKLGAPLKKTAGWQKPKVRPFALKTGGLRINKNEPKTNLKLIPLIFIMVIGAGTLLSMRPSSSSGNDSAAQFEPVSYTPEKQESSPNNSTSEAKDYFSDVLTESSTSNFNFTSSDFDLSSNEEFSKELSSHYGTSDFCNSGCNVYDSRGNHVRVTCFGSTNSCTTYSSSGETIRTYCSSYINSCNSYSSSGDSYRTSCSDYTNNCNTTGSNGYHSNTHCSEYTGSCSTYDSDGGYSNTHCSRYTSSCSTYGSDGSYSTTHCSRYTNSCTSY
jgi:hypothetical protein